MCYFDTQKSIYSTVLSALVLMLVQLPIKSVNFKNIDINIYVYLIQR